MTFQREQTEFFPCRQVFRSDGVFVYVLVVVHREFWNLDLSVRARDEVHVFSFRKGNDEFLDEGGHVLVGDNCTFIFLDVEYRCRDCDLHVLLYFDLTGQTPVVLDLFAAEMYGLSRKNFSASAQHLNFALAAAAFAAACRGEEYVVVGHGG